jgi:hypothetical protein
VLSTEADDFLIDLGLCGSRAYASGHVAQAGTILVCYLEDDSETPSHHHSLQQSARSRSAR